MTQHRSPDLLVGDDHIGLATNLADTARRLLLQEIGSRPEGSFKPDRSFVTQTDLLIELRLREMIHARFPDHGIIGEEHGGQDVGASHVWVLDPIDGTAQFIAGMPVYGTLIALAVDGVPVLGLIDIPSIDARWLGASGQPTKRNGEIVTVHGCPALDQAIMTNSNQDYMSPAERSALDRLRGLTATRIYGGASLNYGLLASGRTDLALDAGQQIYDFAPFRPIIEGAGGTITDWSGRLLTLESDGRLLGAGNAALHKAALEEILTLNVGSAAPGTKRAG
ncbi:inositol monophosphatase family protein [Paracoccus sp. APAP_BH8]|uniref:inositol monophosphatase family protein n=1 Tax=Paracoccus sp. APAP_BH8 TaxID=3110237 RepID=UPI002FD82393